MTNNGELTKKNNVFENTQYKSDTHNVVKFAKFLLTPVGVWPCLDKFIFSNRIGFTIYVSIIFGLMCFLLIPHFIHTFNYTGDLGELMKIVAAQCYSSVGVLKFLMFAMEKKKIRICVDEIERFYRNIQTLEEHDIIKNSAKVGKIFASVYLGVSYGGALPYHVAMPLMAERIILEDNSTRIPLSYPSEYVVFDVLQWSLPQYTILFIEQMVTSNIIVATNCGCFCFIAACIMHACCIFEIVCHHLETLVQKERRNEIDDVVKSVQNIVQLHNDALDYVETIEKSISTLMLWEMGGYTIIICFLEFGALQDLRGGNVFGLVTFLILACSAFCNVFILSFIGDRLMQQSLKVGELAYSVQWFDLPKSAVTNLIFIIMRSNRESKVAAGKVFYLSLQGFADVRNNEIY